MSQPVAVSSASLARSSPRCQAWSSLPRFPSGWSRLWSGPATKPSSEIDMWQVVSGIAILSSAERGPQRLDVGRSEHHAVASGDVDEVEVHSCPRHLAREVGEDARMVLHVDHDDLAL